MPNFLWHLEFKPGIIFHFAVRQKIVVSEMELNRIVNAKVLIFNLHLTELRIPIYILYTKIKRF